MRSALGDVEVGSVGPDFTLESNDAVQITLSEFRGRRNVVLYFMREFT